MLAAVRCTFSWWSSTSVQDMLTWSARSGSRLVSQIPHCWVSFRSRFSLRKVNIESNGSGTSLSLHSPSAILRANKDLQYTPLKEQLRQTVHLDHASNNLSFSPCSLYRTQRALYCPVRMRTGSSSVNTI